MGADSIPDHFMLSEKVQSGIVHWFDKLCLEYCHDVESCADEIHN